MHTVEYIAKAGRFRLPGLPLQWLYVVKWVGADLDELSWEPESIFQGAPEFLASFWKSTNVDPTKRVKEGTEVPASKKWIRDQIELNVKRQQAAAIHDEHVPPAQPEPTNAPNSPLTPDITSETRPSHKLRRKRAVSSSPEPESIRNQTQDSIDIDDATEGASADNKSPSEVQPIFTKRRLTQAAAEEDENTVLVSAPPVSIKKSRLPVSVLRHEKGKLVVHRLKASRLIEVAPVAAPPKKPRTPILTQYQADRMAMWDFSSAADTSNDIEMQSPTDMDSHMDDVLPESSYQDTMDQPASPLEQPLPPPLTDFIPQDLSDLEDFPDDEPGPSNIQPESIFGNITGPLEHGSKLGGFGKVGGPLEYGSKHAWRRAIPSVNLDKGLDIRTHPLGRLTREEDERTLPITTKLTIPGDTSLVLTINDFVRSRKPDALSLQTLLQSSPDIEMARMYRQTILDIILDPQGTENACARAVLEHGAGPAERAVYQDLTRYLEHESMFIHASLPNNHNHALLFLSSRSIDSAETLGIPKRLIGLENVLLVYLFNHPVPVTR